MGYGWAWRGVEGRKHRALDAANAILFPPGTYPPIVTQQEWDPVIDRFARNKVEAARSNRDPEATLLRAGYVFCGYCGRSMVVRRAASGHEYKCHGDEGVGGTCEGMPSIRADVLDAAVWEKVRVVMGDPDRIATEVRRMQGDDPTTTDLAAIDRALRACEKERSNYLAAIATMIHPDANTAVASQVESAEERVAKLTAEREAVVSRRRLWQSANDRLGELTIWCRTVAANLDRLTYQERRSALLALGVTAGAYRASHEPRYDFHMNLPLDGSVANRSSRSSEYNRLHLRWRAGDAEPSSETG